MSTVIKNFQFSSGQVLQLVQGDLTKEPVDVIVNAANRWLQHGGGVAGAIVQQGGEIIQKESDRWVQQHGMVTHDAPAFTNAGALPCKYVIHAVGPVWGEGDEEKKLADTIRGSLNLANSMQAHSLAIPPISTGIFGFPKELAAPIFFNEVSRFFSEHPNSDLTLVKITILDQRTIDIFLPAFEAWLEKSSTGGTKL
jgi:O-acetyl-ADP-ribose deacetylase (regulator of RNase III)